MRRYFIVRAYDKSGNKEQKEIKLIVEDKKEEIKKEEVKGEETNTSQQPTYNDQQSTNLDQQPVSNDQQETNDVDMQKIDMTPTKEKKEFKWWNPFSWI